MMTQSNHLTRRSFLKILALSGAAAGGLAVGSRFSLGSLTGRDQPAVQRETVLLMGTVVNLTLVGVDSLQVQAAARAALEKMRILVDIFNLFDPASQLCRLNAQSKLYNPHPALVSILEQSQLVNQASEGAFDVSVKPLLDTYLSAPTGNLPGAGEISLALRKVGSQYIAIGRDEINYQIPGMGVTLDGIAKGAVIDAGVEILKATGFENVIVEAGGDLLAAGAHPGGRPWKIALRSPRSDSSFRMPVLKVENMAVATSGDYLQPFSSNFSEHHILDPRQGVSSPELASVTVLAPTAALADALATAIMASGRKAGLHLLASFPGCEAFLVDKQLQAFPSPGLGKFLV